MKKNQKGSTASAKAVDQTHTISPSVTAKSGCSQSDSANPEKLSKWRTYYTMTTLSGRREERTQPNFMTLAFLAYIDLNLGETIQRKNLVSDQYYSKYTVLTFKTPRRMTLAEFNRQMDRQGDVEHVYTWIPTMAVKMARRGCYCSKHDRHPFFKINVVTDDDEKFDTIEVTVYEKQNNLLKDVNKEIQFYLTRKGYFNANTDILEIIPELSFAPEGVR